MLRFQSKLPSGDTTIFTLMSNLAREYDAINLGQGFPDFDCSPDLKERIQFHLDHNRNQYAPMIGAQPLRQRIAQKIHLLYDNLVDHNDEITITAGATQAIFTTISAFVKQGDEVIIMEPAYDSYTPSIQLNGGKPIPYAMLGPDFKIDWHAIKQLISDRTKMIIINSPHNPTGTTLSEDDYLELEKIVHGTDIVILSDEVYEHLVYDQKKHVSILSFPKLYNRSLVTFSFGKTFHCTGWKIGYVVAPGYITREFRKVHQWNVFSVNSFVQYGLADYMNNPENYLRLPDFYQQKRDFFNQNTQGSKLKPLVSKGTFFQLFDYSTLSQKKDTDFATQLTIDHGVASIPISVFYTKAPEQHYIRFCFAKKEDTLLKAAQILKDI